MACADYGKLLINLRSIYYRFGNAAITSYANDISYVIG